MIITKSRKKLAYRTDLKVTNENRLFNYWRRRLLEEREPICANESKKMLHLVEMSIFVRTYTSCLLDVH